MIAIRSLHKSYHGTAVLKGLNLDIPDRQTMVLIGKSGCGKSTFLRCINSLEDFDRGEIRVGDVLLERPLKPGGREREYESRAGRIRQRVGMVFQSFNLFPHLTLLDNLTIAPVVVKRVARAEAEQIAFALLKKVDLSMHAHKYPEQLSGGQCQRAAIARALAMSPEVMLYDEPTSALDPGLTDEVLDVMRKLSEEGLTQVIVTHEMQFARDVADWVFYMDEGELVEGGTPEQVFSAPTDERTKKFLRRYL